MPPKVAAVKAPPKASTSHDTLPNINKDKQKSTDKVITNASTTTSLSAVTPTTSKPVATSKTNGITSKATTTHANVPSNNHTKLPQIGSTTTKSSATTTATNAPHKDKANADTKLLTPTIVTPRQNGSSKDKSSTPCINSSRKVESVASNAPPRIAEVTTETDTIPVVTETVIEPVHEVETAMEILDIKSNDIVPVEEAPTVAVETTASNHVDDFNNTEESVDALTLAAPVEVVIPTEAAVQNANHSSTELEVTESNDTTMDVVVAIVDSPNITGSDDDIHNIITTNDAVNVTSTGGDDSNSNITETVSGVVAADADSAVSSSSGDGKVRLMYELYNESFTIRNGQLTSQDIDDVYNLSFAMPKCRIHLSKFNPTQRREMIIASNEGGMSETDSDGLSSSQLFFVKETITSVTPSSAADESADDTNTAAATAMTTATLYHDLIADVDYYVYVEQEAAQLKQDQLKMKQVINQMDGNDGDDEDNGGYDDYFEGHGDDDENDGEGGDNGDNNESGGKKKKKKSATALKVNNDDGRVLESCSCVYGNPCVDEYGCKDWTNRFAIATTNGWKGF